MWTNTTFQMKKIFILSAFLYFSINAYSQLSVNTGVNASQLVQTLVGNGIVFSNASIDCPNGAFGIFGNGGTTSLGLDSGIVLTTGTAIGLGSGASTNNSIINNSAGDPDLNTYGATVDPTHDACALEFDVVPICDTLRFKYVFGSEEYPEFVSGTYEDAFAFLISGPGLGAGYTNIAYLPSSTTPINIHTINAGTFNCPGPTTGCVNCLYYIENCSGTDVVYDGFTTVLTAEQVVTACSTYHVKLLIADGTDFSFDSGVFLKKGTLSCFGVSIGASNGGSDGINAVESCQDGQFQICMANSLPTPFTFHFNIGGSATAGADYTAFPDSVTFPPGTECVVIDVLQIPDALTEGSETIKLYYEPSGCSGTDSVTITISDVYAADAGADLSYCNGDSIPIGPLPIPGTSYSWNTSVGLSDTTIAQPWVSLTNFSANPVTYDFVLTSTIGSCTDSDSVAITVLVLPQIPNAGPDTLVCEGVPVQLGSAPDPGLTYDWTPITGLDSATVSNPIATPAFDTFYTMNAYNACGSSSDFVFFDINPLPVADAGVDDSFCNGDSVQLNGFGGLQYVWSPAAGLSDDSIANPWATPVATTTYTLLVTNNCGQDTASVLISVESPLMLEAGQDVTLCLGETTTLNAGSTGTNFSWSPTLGLSDPGIANPVVMIAATTEFFVTVSNSCGLIEDSLTVTILPVPTVEAGFDQTICIGHTVPLLGVGTGTFAWLPVTGLDNPGISNPNANPTTTTTYTLTVTGMNNCSKSDSLTIFVDPCTQVPNYHLEKEVFIYPNPAREMFKIKFSETPAQGTIFVLKDLLGKEINLVEMQRHEETIWRGTLPAGLYFWELIIPGADTKTGKIILE